MSGSMPLVASDGGDEAFGSPSRFRDGVDHLFVAARSPAGCDVRETEVDPMPRRGSHFRRSQCRQRGSSRRVRVRRATSPNISRYRQRPSVAPLGRVRPQSVQLVL